MFRFQNTFSTHRADPATQRRRGGFTLMEILVVLLVISVLAGMVTAALQNVGQTARIARTKGIIAVINDTLMTKYESYKTRPLPVVVPNFSSGSEISVEVPPREAARVRLNMIRDLMRMEMPDRKIDLIDPPANLSAAVYRVIYDTNTDQIQRTSPRVKSSVDWYDSANIPSQMAAYRDRLPGAPPAFVDWTREFESAECLYLIMATSFTAGTPALEGIPSGNIGDIDDDGMQEILDGWQRPIGFLRWPVGYESAVTALTDQPDEFDPFRTDWGFLKDSVEKPFSVRPLVVSAGPDREFNIRFGYGSTTANDPTQDVRYSKMTWPTSDMPANEQAGHEPTYIFVDPYQRQGYTPGNRIGSPTDTSDARDDNITNYELQAST